MTIATLIPQLEAIGKAAETRRVEIETQRKIPEDIIQQLKASGTLRLWVAQAYGGHQAHVLDLLEAIQTLAYYNGSIAWIAAVTGTASLASGYLNPKAAQTIFGASDAMTGGWAAPAGKAKIVEGGLLVSGQWRWGSGIAHCSHILGGVLIQSEKDKTPRSAIAYFEPKAVQLIDNWQVLGLKGTNSIDYQVDQYFVPDENWIYFPVQKAEIDDTLYRFSFLGALASGVASVGLGLARRAIDEILILGKSKIPNGARKSLSERPIVHEKIGQIEAQYQSAKLYLEKAVEKNWQEAKQSKISLQTKSELRLAASFAVQNAIQIVQAAYQIGGGSSIWDGVKLQELLRDINVVSQHGLVAATNIEIAGRTAFGLPVNEWLL
jgi:alkylation response protein AidB-like acyl-CoA dehydrogenase